MKNLLLLFCLLVLGACSSPQREAIDRLEAFAAEIEKEASYYDEADWQRAEARYDSLIATMQGLTFSQREQTDFTEAQAKCGYALLKGKVSASRIQQTADTERLKANLDSLQHALKDSL